MTSWAVCLSSMSCFFASAHCFVLLIFFNFYRYSIQILNFLSWISAGMSPIINGNAYLFHLLIIITRPRPKRGHSPGQPLRHDLFLEKLFIYLSTYVHPSFFLSFLFLTGLFAPIFHSYHNSTFYVQWYSWFLNL